MKFARIGVALAMPFLLTSCLLTPGKFDAAMDIRRDGTFTYRYTGEISLLNAQTLINFVAENDLEEFDPEAEVCYADTSSQAVDLKTTAFAASQEVSTDDDLVIETEDAETRDCTEEEIKEARKAWEETRKTKTEERKRLMKAVKEVLGGLDPSDVKTMNEFARRIEKFEGWKSVKYKADGVFDVTYSVNGRLEPDFIFPAFPNAEIIMPFLQVSRRTGGKVLIVAPGFYQSKENGFGSLATLGALASSQELKGLEMLKRPEGTFTITTNAEILSNNTEDGPETAAGGRALKWTVGVLDNKKPEALLQL